ncbi:hypothetical protein AGLY_016552 [Aphis glycines]|uniref:Chromo domain-containing protein n=1 Tax=Aphis glycines TaxID=307491 RepID=A0A6G0SY74_APHGL|nr:hypothetical protein AGLY_016552 [Aphis glycines]
MTDIFRVFSCREFFYLTTSPVYDSDPGVPQSSARTLHSWTLTVAVVRSLVHVCSSQLLVITFNSDLRHRLSHVERQLFSEDKKSDIQDVNMDSPFVNEPLADPYEHLQQPPQQLDPVDVPDLNIAGPSSSSSQENKEHVDSASKAEEKGRRRKRTLFKTRCACCESWDTKRIKKREKRSAQKEKNDVTNDIDENGAPPEKVVEKVVELFNMDGELQYLMKWQGVEEASLISAKEANLNWPQVVIKYYENLITWKS